jgi:hypothetical protein
MFKNTSICVRKSKAIISVKFSSMAKSGEERRKECFTDSPGLPRAVMFNPWAAFEIR